MNRDVQLLRLLSLFYCLGAGFAGLLPLIGAVGLGTTVYYMTREDLIGRTAPPTSTDKMILALGIYAVLVGTALTVGFVLAGRYLQKCAPIRSAS